MANSLKFGKFFALTLTTSILLSLIFLAGQADAQETTIELINPIDGTHDFNFTTDQKTVGDTFTINISIFNVQDLITWQVKVGWDPTLLNFSKITLPSDHIFAGKSFYVMGPAREPGAVTYALALASGQSSFTGSGRLAQLELEIVKAPSSGQTLNCNITFLNVPMDTFLLNSIGMDIPFTTVNAHYFYEAPWIPPPQATLFINPKRVVDPTLTIGSSFNVNLSIINITDLHHWKTKLIYDKTILNVTNVVEGTFLKSEGSTIFNFEIQDYNTTHSLVDMNCTLVDAVGVSGTGDLATINFTVQGLGLSYITIMEPDLRNPFDMPLPFIWYDGYFNNILMVKLSIEPSEVSGPEYTPGTTFTINVTLDDVENLKTCVFNLTYNPSVIMEIDIGVPSVLGKTPMKKLQVDDYAGYIWANLTYTGGIATYNPVTLMSVMFQVVNLGISPINLTDTHLYDINNQPLAHEVYHGIFIGLIRDVAVINVTTDLNIAYQGWNVMVNITVKNKGNLTETFNVKFCFNLTIGGTATIENLAPNEETTITILWNTQTVEPCHNYAITAYAGPVPYEINLGDNELKDGSVKIRPMGDINGDGLVDSRDAVEAILSFRAYPGHPKWNPLLDLDRNNIIDARDIVIILLNFQKKCA